MDSYVKFDIKMSFNFKKKICSNHWKKTKPKVTHFWTELDKGFK